MQKILNISNCNPPILLLLTGLPGSGKSTFTQILTDFPEIQTSFEQIIYIDIDNIRQTIIGPIFDPLRENEIIDEKHRQVLDALQPNRLVIVDDLHYYASMRHFYYELCLEQGFHFINIYINTPIKICQKWNIKRGSPIPNELIKEIEEKFDIPGKKYKWDIPHLKFDLSHIFLEEAIDQTILLIQQTLSTPLKKKKLDFEPETFDSEFSTKLESADLEQLDLITRNLISDVYLNKFSPQINSKLKELLSQKTLTSEIPSDPYMGLAKYRKNFMTWLVKNSNYSPTINNLIEFLS